MRLKLKAVSASRKIMLLIIMGPLFWSACSSPAYIAQNELLLEQGKTDQVIETIKAAIADCANYISICKYF